MLPNTGDILRQDFRVQRQPSRTYRLKNGRIQGYVDGLEAVKQSVYCILNTERFEYIIYSWNYGVELSRVYGNASGLICSKVKKRIREALMRDDRIRSVGDFSFSQSRGKLSVRFTVSCDQGEFAAEKEVNADV